MISPSLAAQPPFFTSLDIKKDPNGVILKYKELVLLHNGENFSKLIFAPVLKACSKSSALSPGEQIHTQTIKYGLSSDIYVQTSLVTMYSSCDQLELALNVFEKMPQRNVVTWTTMMDSCLRVEKYEMVLSIFRRMQESGVSPDDFAIVSVLTACARLGAALGLGMWVHAYVRKTERELTVFTGTALIDMYCKCGNADDALMVFRSMEKKSVRCWNAMLHGLSVHGRGEEALALFTEMEREGEVRPNEVTFVGVLCGCSHSGLIEEGRFYFDLMQKKYGIEPTVKHYGCMVDLLGRVGLLEEAFEMVTKMRVPPNMVVWGSLLSACRAQNNVDMAERVFQRIVEIEDSNVQHDTSHYVIMSNMYAQMGRQDRMAEVRGKIGKKPKGWSSIETEGDVHQFSVGDASHPMRGKILEMLNEVRRKVERDDTGKDDFLDPHSEKLAVAYGLLSMNSAAPIKIVKNLRICEDCHDMMKLISKVYEREIIVRDCTRFHRFMRGGCSCKDYW
ncbi:hypothetical protein ACHQM5_001139 [Ranunculus cassubicifolius]